MACLNLGCNKDDPLALQVVGEEEDVSVYDIADHPDFRFRTTDIVIRLGGTEIDVLPDGTQVICLFW